MVSEAERFEGSMRHGGVRLRFVRWGSGPGARELSTDGRGEPGASTRQPPLVLLHGFAQSAETWAQAAPSLARFRAVYALDLVGHGESDRPAQPSAYSLDAQAEALLAFMGELAGEAAKPIVAGYSMGGRVALAAALRDPSRFGALALESAGLGPRSHAEREASFAADAERARRLRAHGVRPFMDDWARLPLFETQARLPEAVRDRLRAGRLANDPEALARTFEGAGQHAMPDRARVLEALPRFPFRVLYLCGGLDAKYRAVGEELARLEGASNIAVETVAEAGHNVHVEQPDRFARLLEAFLASLV